ncbi:C40 family peptidase [Mammaliicoccus fleurettii]|uniref:C40 family peptidase n=1 Tax=Mammaliicoccus fleurettii TaxID=150056 RepID=A0ABS5MPJ8_9STAP|nr:MULTISPECIES: C40 family peptidase [Mammaliicoccus]MBL0848378.1 C40 family peptidase [Mammaliicoccus fleurettii]MBS3673140.1 C40 family peptidase [Mammaliicoccus fleurettii]MBS3697855.1 C40 family peptidase [Mammaliicoccus fleurettii]MBW0764353.1 C40 family peptidase [Mammaliicoccus fleurettii]MEB6202576.1 C40 family peptidase [Mammaliicoccus fleurettii]
MKKYCRVNVGTIWRSADKARDIDRDGIMYPANIQRWLLELSLKEKLSFTEDSRIDTQILYGEMVEVIDEQDGWSYVICTEQASKQHKKGYPGYIPTSQLSEMKDYQSHQKARVKVPKTTLFNLDFTTKQILSFNTVLPVTNNNDEYIEVDTPEGTGLIHSRDIILSDEQGTFLKGTMQGVIENARLFLDLPYLWGGMSSYGYDCSGLCYQMYKSQNFHIPRDADEQYEAMEDVSIEQKAFEPGDLLFFSKPEDKGFLSHVGIYMGDDMMIHAPHTPKSIEIVKLTGSYYQKILVKAARLLDF